MKRPQRALAQRSALGRALAAALLVVSALATPGRALADGTADEADIHFRLGASAFQRREYDAALVHFFASNRLAPNRNVLFNIASTYERLKLYGHAYRYYVEALEGETDAAARKAGADGVARVLPFVAVIAITTTPPGATIYVDRQDLGSQGRAPRLLALPEGRHRIIAELDGYETATSDELNAHTGDETKVALVLRRLEGTVHVDVKGGASAAVRVGDDRAQVVCTAPCDARLPAGRHELHFTAEGMEATPRLVIVAPGETTRALAELRPLTGSLIVHAEENGALVTVDGRPRGFTPVVIPGVAVGKRVIRVTLKGHAPYETTIEIEPNREAQLMQVELPPTREVTAVSRYAQALEDAPSSVSVIDGQELRAFGYPTIAEALRGTRGISVSNDRAYASVGIRALGQPNDYGNRVLILSDGQPLNDNLLNSSYIGSDGRADLEDVERIEVVRGPGSLLYGAGALSGVINLVTLPRDEPTSAHVGFGTYDNAAVRGRAGFYYNAGNDRGVWASVSAAHSDGIDVSIPLKGAGGVSSTAHGVDAFDSIGTAGRAYWGHATLQWFYHTRDQSIPVGAYSTKFDDPRTYFDDTRMMTELRYERSLTDQIELLARAHANRYVFHGFYAYTDGYNLEDFYGTWFGVELRAVYKPSSKARITLGIEGQVHPQATLLGENHGDDGSSASYLAEHDPYTFGAAYLVSELAPTKWLRVEGGSRLDVYSTFGPIFVPRVAVIVKPWEGSTLKVMGGRAFRAPSIYEQVYNDGGISQVRAVDPARGLSLAPESVYSGEVELSQRFKRDWVALAALHASEIVDIIQSIPDSPGSALVRYANSPAPVAAIGGDLEVRREWRRGWMLSAMYGYEHAQFIGSSAAPNPELVNAPQHLASLKGVAPVLDDIVSVALRATLEAPRRISVDDSTTTSTGVVLDLAVSGNIPGFGIHYALGVYNLGDLHYAYPVTDTFLSRTMPQNGRTVLLDLLARYP